MKITDYTLIQEQILDKLQDQQWTITDYLPVQTIVLAVSNIYTTNDMCSGFGQDFKSKPLSNDTYIGQPISIISSQERISIITSDGMSYYKSDVPICGYENLEEDIAYIFMIIQLVLDRIDSQ